MTDVGYSSIIGSMTKILNNTSLLADPFNGTRVGSFFFGPDEDIFYQKYMPKGQVRDSSFVQQNPSFGRAFEREEYYTVDVHFYVKRGDIGSGTGNLKNRVLVQHYLKLIRNAVITNSNQFGRARLDNIGEVDPPVYLRDDNIYVGTIPFTFIDVTTD